MHRPSPQSTSTVDTAPLPLEPMTVRIPTAIKLTGIGRSKLYQLVASGEIETVKVGASTLVSVASLRRLTKTDRDATKTDKKQSA